MFRLINRWAAPRQTAWWLVPVLFILFILPAGVRAAVCDQNTNLVFVAADPSGSLIPGAKVDVYKQTTDANGNTRPGQRFTGGTTDAVLGQVSLSWRNSAVVSDIYAIRVQKVTKDNASFWFYDIDLTCGATATVNRTLSGLAINFYEADGGILANTNFSIYSQLRTSGGSLLADKDELLLSGSSGSSGRVKVYLPQGSVRSLDNTGPDFYVLEVSHGGVKSYFYGLEVKDGQLTNVDYYLSILRVRLKDANDKSAVGTKVEVYKQNVTLNNEYQTGAKVGEFTIKDNGYGSLELSSDIYALGVKGTDGKYQYFWDINVAAGKTSEYLLNLNAAATDTACPKASNLNIILRRVSGDIIPGLKFEVYEQNLDANGLPSAGTKVAGGTIGASGRAPVSFKPDPAKSYALKVWDKRADLGDFWFFDAVKFVCGYDRSLTKTVPAVRVVLRDGAGSLKRNYNFSLSAQEYDADNNPVIADNGLIANLKTDAGGQAVVYVAPYNPYRRGQSGIYAITTKDNNGNAVNFYNITPVSDKDYVFEARTSGLSGVLQDARGKAQSGRTVTLYSYSLDGTTKRLGASLVSAKTDASGRFNFEYPAGTYALAVADDFGQPDVFWSIGVKAGSASQKLTLNLTNFSLSDALGEGLPAEPLIRIYSLSASAAGGYFRDQEVGNFKLSDRTAVKSLAAGPYLAVYNGKGEREYGTAFYAVKGKSQNVNIVMSGKSAISAGQSFSVTASTATGVSAGSGSGSFSLPNLRGRILLQVESRGEAWYVDPASGAKYYLGRPADAWSVMRALGLGISNANFGALENNPAAWKSLAGKILLKTEDSGKAYYFDPVKLQLHYLGRPADAWSVMRAFGLGITDNNLNKIATGKQ
jgi:hypothetical protein